MFEGLRCILRADTILLPVYIYCGTKLIFKTEENDNPSKVLTFMVLRLLSTIILTPIFLILFLAAALLADFVRFLAKIYFGDEFIDFATGGDAMYSGDHRIGKGVIPAIYYIEEKNAETVQLLMNHINRGTIKAQRNHPRLQCIQKQFLGYIFFLKTTSVGLNFVTYFNDYNNDEEFQDVLNAKIGSALPLNNKFLWDVTIGKKSVKVQGKNCIPILFRLHHSLGDGVTLITLLMTNYVDNGCENIRILCNNLKKLSTKTARIEKPKSIHLYEDLMKSALKFLNWIWNHEFYFGFDLLKDAETPNSWHDEPGGEIALLAIGLDKREGFLEKIKAIKKKLNVAFNDVVLGVISASFTKFFVENRTSCPSTIVTLNPYNLNANNFNDLLSFNALNEPITNLGNKFTIGLISLPIKEEYLKDPKTFITEQHKITKYLKYSIDFQYMFWLVHKIVSITPLPIVVPIHKLYRTSTLVTNLPPLTPIKIIGLDIIDMGLSSVHCYDVSTCICVYSYRDIFHVSTMIDKKCISPEEQKVFTENIIKFIDEIYNDL